MAEFEKHVGLGNNGAQPQPLATGQGGPGQRTSAERGAGQGSPGQGGVSGQAKGAPLASPAGAAKAPEVGTSRSADLMGGAASVAMPGGGGTSPGSRSTGGGKGGAENFDNFTPNTEAVLPEPSIEDGLEAMAEDLREGTAKAATDPDKGAGAGEAPRARSSNGLWLCAGLAALLVGALVLRPGRRRA